jgi:hypothetical protein
MKVRRPLWLVAPWKRRKRNQPAFFSYNLAILLIRSFGRNNAAAYKDKLQLTVAIG